MSLIYSSKKPTSSYLSTASLPSLALGLIHPDLPNIISHQQSPSEKNIDLSAEADWLVAIRKTLARQSTYNNVISEILKGITLVRKWYTQQYLIGFIFVRVCMEMCSQIWKEEGEKLMIIYKTLTISEQYQTQTQCLLELNQVIELYFVIQKLLLHA